MVYYQKSLMHNSGFAAAKWLSKEDIHWAVMSKIPPRQGLNPVPLFNCSAQGLADATNTDVEDEQYVSMAADAQISADVSTTGSVDDEGPSYTRMETRRPSSRQYREVVGR